MQMFEWRCGCGESGHAASLSNLLTTILQGHSPLNIGDELVVFVSIILVKGKTPWVACLAHHRYGEEKPTT